jgi:hypothetical protein
MSRAHARPSPAPAAQAAAPEQSASVLSALGSNAEQLAQLVANPLVQACDSVLGLFGASCSGPAGTAASPAKSAAPGTTPAPAKPAARPAAPAPAVPPSKLTPRNSQRPGVDSNARPPVDLAGLARAGYTVYPMAAVDVLYSGAKKGPDAPLSQQPLGGKGYDAVLSGTFTTDYVQSAGPIVRDGKMDTQGHAKATGRGGMAVLQDGSIVVGRAEGRTNEQVQSTFGAPGNPVRDFMGGGALLVENGKAVGDADLRGRQQFDQGGGGIQAQQMRTTQHVLVGIRDGEAFALVAHEKSGASMQRDLTGFGFDAVVKYDGGSGAAVRDGAGGSPEYRGKNSTGIGIHTRR